MRPQADSPGYGNLVDPQPDGPREGRREPARSPEPAPAALQAANQGMPMGPRVSACGLDPGLHSPGPSGR
jgi:hypothetical protein